MKFTSICLALACLCVCLSAKAQKKTEPPAAKKEMQSVRTQQAMEIDGFLNEDAWSDAPVTSGFTTLEPKPGKEASQRTEVKIVYDNLGIYVGAMLYDDEPTGIQKELSQRDNFGNTDWFGVFIDPYMGGINGVSFILTPAGVQFDARYSVFGEDESWDAVWESKARITPEGWVSEIFIPYAALRFPKTDVQRWHINFGRLIQREQEKSFWSEIKPDVNGFLNQAGVINGIENIKSPIRLQATPFVAVYGQIYSEPGQANSFGHSINGGMDIKYGINDAFTLDMTLIPDFGEAQSDNQVLNLGPFEVRFDENRQFFTEGIELFNKGGLFYSRRAGGRPLYRGNVEDQLIGDEEIIENPAQSQLVNATKISGRTKKGLGIGFFNATSAPTYARVRSEESGTRDILTDPLTNYNVLVFDQNLPNNSYVTLINTTVLRDGAAYDANVSGAVMELRNKKQSFGVDGSYKLSQKYFTDRTDLGHAFNLGTRKLSGNFNIGVMYSEESDTYDPNDLGFLFNNNSRSLNMFTNYNFFDGLGPFNQFTFGGWMGYERLYNPDEFVSFGVEAFVWGQLKNFWEVNAWTFTRPGASFDYFEPRTEGRFYRNPTMNNVGFWMGTDSRKRIRISLNGRLTNFGEAGRNTTSMMVSPRFRVSDKFNMSLQMRSTLEAGDVGYVDKIAKKDGLDDDVIFGRRDVRTVENTFNTGYTFNENMALTLRLRHYWSKVEYEAYHLLEEDGRLGPTEYAKNRNTNFNAFNVDMVYRWRFAPGSDLFIVWKNAILNNGDQVNLNYMDNVSNLFNNPQTNSLSMKLIYFLDYNSIVRRRVPIELDFDAQDQMMSMSMAEQRRSGR